MHCLFVKAPFAGWIVDNIKIIEYRTRETYIRGRIGIIESGTGTVIGDTLLNDCVFDPELGLYTWALRNARRYTTPVPFEHKRGYVTWAILDIDPDQQQIAPAPPQKEYIAEALKYAEAIEAWKAECTARMAEK